MVRKDTTFERNKIKGTDSGVIIQVHYQIRSKPQPNQKSINLWNLINCLKRL